MCGEVFLRVFALNATRRVYCAFCEDLRKIVDRDEFQVIAIDHNACVCTVVGRQQH